MSKLQSVLLQVFIELAQKGFCLPSGYSDDTEQKEGATQFEDVEQGGLGEGQGAKDVSDQIEDQDQVRQLFIYHMNDFVKNNGTCLGQNGLS